MRSVFLFLAISIATLLSAQDSTFVEYLNKGRAFADQGDFSNAKVALLRAYSIDSKNDTLLNELAYCYYQTNSFRTAIDYANKLIKLKMPLSADGFVVKCAAYEGLKKLDFAAHWYKKGVALYPEKHELNLNYAFALFASKSYAEAEYFATQAVLTNRRNEKAHFLLYQISMAQGHRPKALLAVLYYSLLLQQEEACTEAFRLVTKSWWATPNLEGSRLMRTTHSNIDFDGFGAIESLINRVNIGFELHLTPNEELTKLTEANKELFTYLFTNFSKYPDNFWWQFYGRFYGEMGNKQFAEACTYYLARNTYKVEVLTHVSGEVVDFSKFSFWLEMEFMK